MTEQLNTEDKQPKPYRPRWACVALFIFILAILILDVGGFSYNYFKLSKATNELTKEIDSIQTTLISNQKEVTAMQTSLNTLEQNGDKAQALSQQQEQLISEWRSAQQGNLDKWRVAEAQHLVKIAQNYLEFSHNIKVAQGLLEQAEKILEPLDKTELVEIRQALVSDISRLKGTSSIDVTALFLKLSALNEQIDKMPLPETIASSAPGLSTEATDANLSWWKAGLAYTWQGLSKIVVVRKTGPDALPLALPEERIFLYQNLHAQIESAMWALLHENSDIYKNSLASASKWTKQYFSQEAVETKAVLQALDDLQNENIQVDVGNVSTTLALFEHYFAQTKTEQ